MGVTMERKKSELEIVLNYLGFYTPATKFRKVPGGVYFKAKCMQDYEHVDENNNPLLNICKKAKFSPVYKVDSLGKLVRAAYTSACVESIVSKSDVEEGEPYCAICPNYVKNVADKIKNEILAKAVNSKKT